MAEYATNGKASAGVALGSVGTALGAVSLLGGNGGLLGNLFGGNQGATQALIAEKDAKIAELTAQKYSDNQDATLYQATRSENKALRDELFAYITPIANEVASNRERVAVLETTVAKNQEIADLKEQLVKKDLENLASVVNAQGITLANITKTVVPKDAICPEVMARYNSWTAPTTSTTGS